MFSKPRVKLRVKGDIKGDLFKRVSDMGLKGDRKGQLASTWGPKCSKERSSFVCLFVFLSETYLGLYGDERPEGHGQRDDAARFDEERRLGRAGVDADAAVGHQVDHVQRAAHVRRLIAGPKPTRFRQHNQSDTTTHHLILQLKSCTAL